MNDASDREADETVDAFHRGRFRLVQPRTGHRSGMDALLLASVVPDEARGQLVDLGAGSGAVAFAVLARCERLRATLVERDAASADRARRGVLLNGSSARVVEADAASDHRTRAAQGWGNDTADFVLANPPFNPPHARSSPDERRRAAHDAPDGLIETWAATMRAVAKSGAMLGVIVKPVAMAEVMAGWREAITVVPVLPRADASASRLLVTARKGSRADPVIDRPLVLHGADGSFTSTASAILNDGLSLQSARARHT